MFGGRNADDKLPFGERLRNAILKPVDHAAASAPKDSVEPRSVEELEAATRFADDKERLVGLLGAPFAAIIGILVPGALRNARVDAHRVSQSLYHELLAVLLVLAVLMLVMAMLRKRLFLGMVMALYGLAIFNLHYWGFGIPFLLAGSWLLVRSYRLQRDLREATGGGRDGRGTNSSRPAPSRRYTPPTSPRRPLPPKSEDERRAG
jgi:hypothetical protein